ncbi:MAG: hypothetical protein QXG97_00590 [Nitrososphaerota archaeon]
MCREAELVCRILSPYVDRLVESLFTANIDFEEATLESLSEILCLRIELTVRQMVRELNVKMRAGELEELRQIIRENPEAAKRAANYVAKRLKQRVRKIIEEELLVE